MAIVHHRLSEIVSVNRIETAHVQKLLVEQENALMRV